MALDFAYKIYTPGPEVKSAVTHGEAAMAFLAGYIIELALSVDNIFVFLVVFTYFKTPHTLQHRVLFYGMMGALLFRAIFIALGATILAHFEWSMVVFGAFLVFTGFKMGTHSGSIIENEGQQGPEARAQAHSGHGPSSLPKFLVRHQGRLAATPLLAIRN